MDTWNFLSVMPMGLGGYSLLMTHLAWADSPITREYWLKNTDTTIIIRVLTVLIPDSTGKRIMAGQGKHLVVTDFPDQQAEVTDLLTVIDQPPKPLRRIASFMEMVAAASAT